MIRNIELENFKCFEHISMELKNFNVLCGLNSGGKSSIIQAVLLGIETLQDGKYTGNIDLMNSKYNTNLYSFSEILYDDANTERIMVSIKDDKLENVIEYTSDESDNNLKYHVVKGEIDNDEVVRVWYLGSDRKISQYQKRGNAEFLELGRDNEYIGFILERGRSGKLVTDKNRNCKDKDNSLFTTQVNEWLDFIFPGNQVMASTQGNDNLISLKFGKEYRLHKTNVGYGISFVLPILVSGLLAKKGDILIVENPELHLHPKAQSDLITFLAIMAEAGVQIILETHSDHIINGIRKVVVNPDRNIKSKDTAIYFFGMDRSFYNIKINEEAELSEWPEDFMEQEENDLYFIRKMRTLHDNKCTDGF